MSFAAEAGSAPVQAIDIDALPTLSDFGFTGGHGTLMAFAKRVFVPDGPRYLRTEEGDLAIFHNRDLQAVGAMPTVGNVPPAVYFGPAAGTMLDDQEMPGAGLAGVLCNQIFTANGAIHKFVRKILIRQLGAKQIALLEPVAHRVVDALLAPLQPGDVVDFTREVADQMTIRFLGELLGSTPAEEAELDGFVQGFSSLFRTDERDLAAIDCAMHGYRRVLRRIVLRALENGNNALVNQLAEDLAQTELKDDLAYMGRVPRDVGDLLVGNLFDAYHTAAVAAANVLHAIVRRPSVINDLHAHPDKIHHAVIEGLRLEPPVLYFKRRVEEDIAHDGVLIQKGTFVVMMWGVGGLDPSAFSSPFEFDLARSRRGETMFGGGFHICPGRFLAPMLSRVLVETIVQRGIRFKPLVDDAPFYEAYRMSQHPHLQLQITSVGGN